VSFRAYTQFRAEGMGVTGWVRNLPDGSVEAVFEGSAAAVESMVRWCERGPLGAEVEEVQTFPEPYTGEFSRFAIRHG
jgi:acylphosphatase